MTIEITMPEEDSTPVKLNLDQQAVIKNKIKEVQLVLYTISEHIKELEKSEDEDLTQSITVSYRDSLCNLLENYVCDISKQMGHNGYLKKEIERCQLEVRKANIEIHRLENLVGSSRSFNGVPEQLTLMRETFYDFWCTNNNFGLIYDTPGYSQIGKKYGGGFSANNGKLTYYVDLNTTIRMRNSFYSNTPITDEKKAKQEIENLKEHLDLYCVDPKYSKDILELLDTHKNKSYIKEKLKSRFPSLEINNWFIKSVYNSTEVMVIEGLSVVIKNCKELLPTKKELKERNERYN